MPEAPKIAIEPPAPLLEEAARAGGADIVAPQDADGLIWSIPREPERLKELLKTSPARWIQLPFAGIEAFFEADAIDPARTWTCAKRTYGVSTAEGALALLTAAARLIHEHARAQTWERTDPAVDRHRPIAGSTAVIVGTGGIGEALATMLVPLQVRIIGVNRSGRPLPQAERTVRASDLDDVLPEADWVVLCLSLTPETMGLFDGGRFRHMRPDAWIINVARGGLIVTDDLVEALRAGTIAGAGLDVTDPEPLPDGHPLWALPNVLITPHIANTWAMGMPYLQATIERNVRAFGNGEPLEGIVDPSLGY